MNDVFESHEPALAAIQRQNGLANARAAVVYLISDVLEFFNPKETMNDTQVAMTTDFILEEYPYFKTDDLKLAFKNAMKGRYGKLYNRIDGQIIMGWLREYNKERCAAADQQSYNEHKAYLSEEAKPTQGIFYTEYRDALEERARNGDKKAADLIALSDGLIAELERRKYDKARDNLERFYEKEELRKQQKIK